MECDENDDLPLWSSSPQILSYSNVNKNITQILVDGGVSYKIPGQCCSKLSRPLKTRKSENLS
jgi:hypothetical protein